MAPLGTVRSSGPSWKEGKRFSSPRISTALADMLRLSFLDENGLQQVDDLAAGEPGFGRFADRFAQQLARALRFRVAAAIDRRARHERAETLAPVDDALALEFLVGALDGDHAYQQFFGK